MTDPRPVVPPALSVAASLVAIQGVVLLGLGVAELATTDAERSSLGISIGAFFAVYGVALVAAAFGLWRMVGWTRGPVLLNQLIWLGLAWNLRDTPLLAVIVGVAGLIAIAGVLHPASMDALSGERPGPDQSEPGH